MMDAETMDGAEQEAVSESPVIEGSPEQSLASMFFPSLGLADKEAAPAEEASDQVAAGSDPTPEQMPETAPAANDDETIEINRHRYAVKDLPPEYVALHKRERSTQSENDTLRAQLNQMQTQLSMLAQQQAQPFSNPSAPTQTPASAPSPAAASTSAPILPESVRTQLEDGGFPAEALEQALQMAVDSRVQSALAGVLPQVDEIKGLASSLRPLAEKQVFSELDQSDMEAIPGILAEKYADVSAPPQDVLQRMRQIQNVFMNNGIPLNQVYSKPFSLMALDQAVNAIRLEQLQQATPPPAIPRLKPIVSGPPARGGTGATSPAGSVQNRNPQGRFVAQSANQVAF